MLAKITQDTFDAAVMRNIDKFGMEPSEALSKTIEHYTAQGVNLSQIVKDVKVYLPGQNDHHGIFLALQKLKEYPQNDLTNSAAYRDDINTFISECRAGVIQRILAGKKGALAVIIDLISRGKQNDSIALALNAGCALCTENTDMLVQENIVFLCNMLKSWSDLEVLTPLVRMIRLNCMSSEKNKQNFMSENVVSLVIDVFKRNPEDVNFLKEMFSFFRIMTMDDDMSVPFSITHERTRMLVEDNDILRLLINLCFEHSENAHLLTDLLKTLKTVAVREEFCNQIIDLKGVDLLLSILKRDAIDETLLKQVMLTVCALARSDDVKNYIGKNHGIELILNYLEKYIKNKRTVTACCLALKSLSLRHPENGIRIIDALGAEIILKALQLHDNDIEVMKCACAVLRNVLARNKHLKESISKLNAIPVFQRIFDEYPDCEYESKLLLIEFGVDIPLRAEWVGTGYHLPN